MLREKCKEGVRVYWGGCEGTDSDTGTIVKYDSNVFYDYDDVWVEWDSDGNVLHIEYSELVVIPEEINKYSTNDLTEEKAVMFLLSKGYTVSKGVK